MGLRVTRVTVRLFRAQGLRSSSSWALGLRDFCKPFRRVLWVFGRLKLWPRGAPPEGTPIIRSPRRAVKGKQMEELGLFGFRVRG